MGLEVLLAGAYELAGDQLVTSLLESRHDVADEASLDAIWLDCDETGVGVSTSAITLRVPEDSRLLGRHLDELYSQV